MKRALLLVAASAAVYAVVAGWSVTRLPADGIAIHINTSGEVDRYTTRADATGYLAGLGGFLLLLGMAVVCLCGLLPMRWLNIPHKEYWTAPERAALARRMLVWDAAVILSMPLLALTFIPINVALMTDDPAVSGWWIIAPIGVWLIAMACYVAWMTTRRYRPPS